jgi:hypothetical protein
VGGEDIAAGTYTFFPSIAVDACGNVGIGFSASASTIYGGAYYTGRRAGDPPGTVDPSGTLAAGTDYYVRTFGGPRNRWGDYSGISLDPANEATFWAFNEYAMARGTLTLPPLEDGRWATRFGSFASGIDFGDLPASYNVTVYGDDGARHGIGDRYLGSAIDADGDGQASPNADGDDTDGTNDEDGVVPSAGWRVDTGGTVTVTVGGTDGYLVAWIDWDGNGDFADAGDQIIDEAVIVGTHPISFTIPPVPTGGFADPLNARFRLFDAAPVSPTTAYTGLACNGEVEDYQWSGRFPTAVRLASFGAEARGRAIVVSWETAAEIDNLGFYLYRSDAADGDYRRLNDAIIPSRFPGSPRGATYTWLDDQVTPGTLYYYRLEDVDRYGERTFHSPVSATVLAAVDRSIYLPFVSR